jgi:hypothetical protein
LKYNSCIRQGLIGAINLPYTNFCDQIRHIKIDQLKREHPTVAYWQPLACELDPNEASHQDTLYALKEEQLNKLLNKKESCEWKRKMLTFIPFIKLDDCDETFRNELVNQNLG